MIFVSFLYLVVNITIYITFTKLYSIMRGENMTTPVFELRNINYYFDNKHVLENINIKINKGEFLAIVGPNGAGKSTLLKVILGLLPLQKGEIFVEGKMYKGNKTSLKISYVSQKQQLLMRVPSKCERGCSERTNKD